MLSWGALDFKTGYQKAGQWKAGIYIRIDCQVLQTALCKYVRAEQERD